MKLKHLMLALNFCLFVDAANGQQKPSNPNYQDFLSTFFGHFNNHDWEAMSLMYASEAEFKDPSLGPGVHLRSRSDFIEHYEVLQEMIPDVKDSVVGIYPSGNSVVVEFISTGTAPDGSKFELPICAILTIEKGLITKDYVYYDNF